MSFILLKHCSSGPADTNYLTRSYIPDLDAWLGGVDPKQFPTLVLDSVLGKLFANGAAQFTSVIRDPEWAADLACMLAPHLARFPEPAVYMGGFMSAAGPDKPATIAKECGRTCEFLVDAGFKIVIQDALGYFKNYQQPIAKTCCDIATASGLRVMSEALTPKVAPDWLKLQNCWWRSEFLDGKSRDDYKPVAGTWCMWDGQPGLHPVTALRGQFAAQDSMNQRNPVSFQLAKGNQCKAFITWCEGHSCRAVLSTDWSGTPGNALRLVA